MKYIMFEIRSGSLKRHLPFLFAEDLIHKQVAKQITPLIEAMHEGKTVTVVSAGHYIAATGKTYGESETLALQSNPMDAMTIMQYDLMHGLQV